MSPPPGSPPAWPPWRTFPQEIPMPTSRKLRLDLQDLQVESFDSDSRTAANRGTVQGNEETSYNTCETNTCGFETCAADTCMAGTCAASCNGTCFNTCAGGACPAGGETEDPSCAYTCYFIQ